MGQYRLTIPSLSKNRIDEITAILLQYDEYLAAVAASTRRASFAQRRLDIIHKAAEELPDPALMIDVCCRKAHPPMNAVFYRYRRGFYVRLSQML